MVVRLRGLVGPGLIVGLSAALIACGSGSGTPTESSVASSESSTGGLSPGSGGGSGGGSGSSGGASTSSGSGSGSSGPGSGSSGVGAEVGLIGVRCEKRVPPKDLRSKISVDGNDLAAGTYTARVMSGANQATSGPQATVAQATVTCELKN